MRKQPAAQRGKDAVGTPITSRVLQDGALVELLYDQAQRTTTLAVWREGTYAIESSVTDRDERLVPFSPGNNLIKNRVVVLPSRPEEYGSKAKLVEEIATFIHRYVDTSPDFELIAAHYVLFTWLYDGFREVPYLRFQGDYGTGKTRALLVVGSLCYKAFMASGASTVSPLFHILDAFRGTLVLDEADFRFSDEKAEIVKILNNGTVEGMPVLRTMMSRQRELNPRAFHVFGPKLIAMRKTYDDPALESRFVTEVMGTTPLRATVPYNLPMDWDAQALGLRNKLLLFRFHSHHSLKETDALRVPSLSARANQILLPLFSIIESDPLRQMLIAGATTGQKAADAERGMSTEAHILGVIRDLRAECAHPIAISDIAATFRARFGDEYERPITPRWVGSILRRQFHLAPYKSNGRFVVPIEAEPRLHALYDRYGISPPASDTNHQDVGM